LKYRQSQFSFETAIFNRQSKNLIDYVKNNTDDKWQAANLRQVNTYGFEINTNYHFMVNNYNQNISLGYNYLKDNIKQLSVPFSRYALNSIKHQVTASFDTQIFTHFSQNISYRFVQRPDGTQYSVFDAKIIFVVKNLNASISGNNIFNAVYSETNLVPMPKSNYLISMTYTFK